MATSASSQRRFSNRGAAAAQSTVSLDSWSPESFAMKMLSSNTRGPNARDALAWRTQVFEDVDDVIVRGREWPRPPFFTVMPIYWNHDAHRVHLVANIVLGLYFVALAVLRPQWLVVCFHAAGFPPGFSLFILAFQAARFSLMAVQLQATRHFACHGHTKEMLVRICEKAADDDDVMPIEDEFFTAAVGTWCFHTVVNVGLCYCLSGWGGGGVVRGVVLFFSYFLPITYLHVEERLCSMALRMVGLFSKCVVEDFCQNLNRRSIASRDLGLWDLFKGVAPDEVGIVLEPTDDADNSAEQMQEGFWVSMIREHQDMTRELVYVWIRAEITFVLLLVQAVLFIFGFLVMAFVSKIFVFQMTLACIAAGHALMVFAMDLLPSAQVTAMCVSSDVGFRSIRTLSNRHSGREGTSLAVQREHTNYMYYLGGTPCGVHLPFLGGVSLAELLGRVKIIATILPIVVAHFALADRSRGAALLKHGAAANATVNASFNVSSDSSWLLGF